MSFREFKIHFKFYFIVSIILLSSFIYYRVHVMELYGVVQPGQAAVDEFGFFKFSFIIIFFLSFLLSTLSTLVDLLIIKKIIYKKPLSVVLVTGLTVQSALLFFVFSFFIQFLNAFVWLLSGEQPPVVGIDEAEPAILNFILIIALSKLLIELDRKLGRGNFWKFLSGKFYNPSEENRLFIFVDLKDSTAIAEKLGHLKFSEFLRDCYIDFSVVDKYLAEIYQYVGDEVVISWPVDKALKDNNFIKAFYAFVDQLKKREGVYMKKYGLVPFFKAGANMGPVIVTEVGEIKREITYHGDTLNTASRIQGLCNSYGAQFIISDKVKSSVKNTENHIFEDLGKVPLRGKENEIQIFKVSEKCNIIY